MKLGVWFYAKNIFLWYWWDAKGQFISEENKTMLINLRQLGHLTFICTRRPIAYAKNLFRNLVNGYITNNGRQVYYHDYLILDKPLNKMTYYAINIIVIYNIVTMLSLEQQKAMYQMFEMKY